MIPDIPYPWWFDKLLVVSCVQGWRLEIKGYPKLTEFGAWRGRDEANMYGGFYTQEDVRGHSSMK